MKMVRLRFHAPWLPDAHCQFWTVIDDTTSVQTIHDLIEYFNEQQKSLATYYQFHLPKRSTKLKYLKAFVNDCILPPHAQANEILRDNDEVKFRLENNAQNEWLLVQSPPTSKRKRSIEPEVPPPPPPPSNNLDDVLRTIAQPTSSSTNNTFSFQFGNKRGRPIPPRPPVISAVKVSPIVVISMSSSLFSGQLSRSTTSFNQEKLTFI